MSVQLYDFRKAGTMPNGLLLGCWMVCFAVLVLNMQLLTFAPKYATFGDQFYVLHQVRCIGHRAQCSMWSTVNVWCAERNVA